MVLSKNSFVQLAHRMLLKILHFFRVLLFPSSAFVLAPRYHGDGVTTVHNADFQTDPKFAKAYQKAKETGSWGDSDIKWRAFVVCWAAEHAMHIEGDFVECGVNRGGLAMAVIEFTNFSRQTDRKFFLLDTYNGLVDSLLSAEERKDPKKRGGGGYEECYEQVCRTFAPISNAIIVRGPVPQTLSQVTSSRVAYLSIDMNCEVPEIAAAEFFWGKMPTGGVIVLDDYGWDAHYQQKLAFDRFAKERSVRVLCLPTGQGLIFHP